MKFKRLFLLAILACWQSLAFAQSGCTNLIACNFDAGAVTDDGSCTYLSSPVLDPTDFNWDLYYDGSCNGGGVYRYVTFHADGTFTNTFGNSGWWSMCGSVLSMDFDGSNIYYIMTWDGSQVYGDLYNGSTVIGCAWATPDYDYGCTDVIACNYDADADIDDGSCQHESAPATDMALYDFTFEFDIDCDGVDGGANRVFESNGTWYDTTSGAYGHWSLCGNDLIFNFETGPAVYFGTWNGSSFSGYFEFSPGVYSGCFTLVPVILGCTDAIACNYDPAATTYDGSCIHADTPATDMVPNDWSLTYDWDCNGATATTDLDFKADHSWSFPGGPLEGYWSLCGSELTFNFGTGTTTYIGTFNGVGFSGDIYVPTGGIGGCFTLSLSGGGCTDDAACNYDAEATIDDGTCVFVDNPALDPTLYTWTYFFDAGCDGGELSQQITFNANGTWQNDIGSTEDGPYSICGDQLLLHIEDTAWYPGTVTGWTVSGDAIGVSGVVGCFWGYANIDGCTNNTACNYNPDASIEDGSCDYSCHGCTETLACNYDPSATYNDGSCVYEESPALSMTNTEWLMEFDNGCDGATGLSRVEFYSGNNWYSPDTGYSGVWSMCGITLTRTFSSSNFEFIGDYDGAQFSGSYNNAGSYQGCFTMVPLEYGCTDASACTYDPLANWDDGSCDYLDACGVCGGSGTVAGCMNDAACNYDASADCDDGSCIFIDNPALDPTAYTWTYFFDAGCDGGELSQQITFNANGTWQNDIGSTEDGPYSICGDQLLLHIEDTAWYPGTVTGWTVSGDAIGVSGVVGCFWGYANIPGCMDDLACNYNPDATMDDGSCTFSEMPAVDMTANDWLLEFDWNCDGSSGDSQLQFAGDHTWVNPVTGDGGSWAICGNTLTRNFDAFPTLYIGDYDGTGFSGDIEDGSGNVLGCFTLVPLVTGCTDASACTYDPLANWDDESCDYLDACGVCGGSGTVAGCVNDAACNYDASADCDDGSCIFIDNPALDPTAYTWTYFFDAGCDGGEFSSIVTFNADGTWQNDIGGGVDGVWSICGNQLMIHAEDPVWYTGTVDGYTITGDNINAGGIFGCFWGYANIPGCTNDAACNFDPSATEDDGSCIFIDNPALDPTLYQWTYWLDAGCDGGEFSTIVTFNPDGTWQNNIGGGIDGIWSICGDQLMIHAEDPVWYTGTVDGYTISGDNINSGGIFGCFWGEAIIPGCTDPLGCNYDAMANSNDGSCDYVTCYGCMHAPACNYDASATFEDGSCQYYDACGNCGGSGTVSGCTDPTASNYDPSADCDNGSCFVLGCTYPDAPNYSMDATLDDGSCELSGSSTCPNDLNGDGSIGTSDLLMLLAEFGADCPE